MGGGQKGAGWLPEGISARIYAQYSWATSASSLLSFLLAMFLLLRSWY